MDIIEKLNKIITLIMPPKPNKSRKTDKKFAKPKLNLKFAWQKTTKIKGIIKA